MTGFVLAEYTITMRFCMTLTKFNQDFKVMALFDDKYLRNGTRY